MQPVPDNNVKCSLFVTLNNQTCGRNVDHWLKQLTEEFGDSPNIYPVSVADLHILP